MTANLFISLALTAMVALVPAAQADDSQNIDPAGLLSLVKADWNNDGRADKAILLKSSAQDHAVELRIYLSDTSPRGFSLASRHESIVWLGEALHDEPELSVNASGVVLRAGDSASSTTPWHEVYSITRHDEQFVVSRYTVTWHDRRDISAGFRCDMDLLSRRGIRNTASLTSVPAAVKLSQWRRTALPDGCQVKIGQ